MIKLRKLAIDFSSFAWTALLAGKDTENGKVVIFNDKKVTVNSAAYGYEIIMGLLTSLLKSTNHQPRDMLLVFEGKNSKSKRILYDNTYKGGGAPSHPDEAYIEFQKLSDQMRKTWHEVGATGLTQDFAEGDDTLAYLAKCWPGELTIATYDNDISALNSEPGEVNEYGGTCAVWVNSRLNVNKYGSFDFKRLHIYKAMCGDSSDNVKGVVGFGPGAFDALVQAVGWDGMDEIEAMLTLGDLGELHPLAEEMMPVNPRSSKPPEPTPLAKLFKKIVASEESFLKAWRVTALYPQWVNTMNAPLQIVAGKVTSTPLHFDERLEDYYGQDHLITSANYEDALETLVLEGAKGRFITFDIETSTPDESDEWLAAQGDIEGVDQIGSELTGFSYTFGANNQHTIYVCVDHANTDNITMVQAREVMEAAQGLDLPTVIQNTFFELSVLYSAEDEDGTLWRDTWADNGYHGFYPNVLDTKLEGSYVNENVKLGLKARSLLHLGYEQTSYERTTRLSGPAAKLAPGGRLIREWDEETDIAGEDGVVPTELHQTRQYKMRELSGTQVFGYGADDTICTAALHNYYELVMHLEHTWQVYLDVEIDAAYLHAKSFVDGMTVSIAKSKELERIDDATYAKAWETVRACLIANGWAGTVPPVFDQAITAREIKHAYAIVTGQVAGGLVQVDESDEEDEESAVEEVEPESADPILKTKIRTPSKLVTLIRAAGHTVFAAKLTDCLEGDGEGFTKYVNSHFKGEPVFKQGSHQVGRLMYDVLCLTVRVRGKPTANMKKAGIYEGNRKANALAIEYALRDCAGKPATAAVLNALKLLQMVKTRRSLYYAKYPNFVHWKTGKVHGSHNQCGTNTRRASESKPNKQQLPKHPKIEGQLSRYREVVVPHAPDAVIVSADFDSQELRVIADYSRDQNMVDCFIGDNKKSMHSLTGVDIMRKNGLKQPEGLAWTYEAFQGIVDGDLPKTDPLKKLITEYRALGKKTNFTTEFGAMAPKLAETLMCEESEAQIYIDAKEAQFPDVVIWKDSVIAEARQAGFVRTKAGAMRHLREALVNGDRWEQSKAERQAVNTEVQGSAAEMTKLSEGRVWQDNILSDFDCRYIGPVHDELVFSVLIKDLVNFLPRLHAAMVAPYGGMFIPIESSLSFGPSFGQQVEIGLVPSPEAIAKGLAKMRDSYSKKESK